MKNKTLKPKKFDYCWVIAIICFLSICISLGFCSSGSAMYLTAITDALNFKRGAFSISDTLRFVTTSVTNLFLGFLIAKFGTKKLMCFGYICLMAFSTIRASATQLYMFYISGILLGLGLTFTSTSMMSVVVNRWFHKNKGTITGLILSANGLGGAVAVQILSPIIFEPGNPFGYRNSYHVVTAILAVVFILVLIFFRDKPKNAEIDETSIKKKRKVRGTGWIGMDYKDAVKKPYFYLALVCIMFTGMSLQGLGGIAIPHMYDVGIDVQFVATLSTISSLILMATKFSTGYMYDRFGMKITMNICLLSSFLSLLGVVLVANTPIGRAIAAVRIVFAAIALPLETIMLPLYASELFGNKSFDKIVGIFTAVNTAGYAMGAPLANLFFDILGNYNVSFILFAALMLFVTISMQFVLKSANRDRKIILEAAKKENAETINA